MKNLTKTDQLFHFSIPEVEMPLRELPMVDLVRLPNQELFAEIAPVAMPEVSNNSRSNSHTHPETDRPELEQSSRNKARPSRVHHHRIGCLGKAARTL